MTYKKSLVAFLAGIMSISAISISAVAETDSEQYTYVDTNGTDQVITQSELDSDHWDKAKLGSELPIVYETFPASIVHRINEFSECTVDIQYMKSDVDYAELNVVDLSSGSVIFNADISDETVETPVLPIDGEYRFTITESIDNVETEYNKYVKVITESVNMPDYVTDRSTSDDTIVLVGSVDDLKASEIEDEEGNIEIIEGAKRFEQVKASDLDTHFASLPANSVYKIYTRDSSDNTYLGYMNTSDTSYFYMPTIEVRDWESVITPQPYTLPSSITASKVKNANATVISQYKDFAFDLRDSDSTYYKVFKFELPELLDSPDSQFDMILNANTTTTIETWLWKSGSSNPVKRNTKTYSNGRTSSELILEALNCEDASTGDYLYFVVYSTATKNYGYFCFRESDFTYNDDVCGSVYEIYDKRPTSSIMSMDETSYYYTTTDYRDVDTFYLDYSGSTSRKIKFTLSNQREKDENKKRTKYLEVYILTPKSGALESIGAPGDIYEAAPGKSVQPIVYPTYSNQYFMSVSDVASNNSGSISFNDINEEVEPCTYSVWTGFKD